MTYFWIDILLIIFSFVILKLGRYWHFLARYRFRNRWRHDFATKNSSLICLILFIWLQFSICYYNYVFSIIKGWEDTGAFWRVTDFEIDKVEQMTSRLYDEILPLYTELHTYVRRKLIEFYPEQNMDPKGSIPAHLLGKCRLLIVR